MTTIVTRAGKGSPLTNTEMDTNLTNLNNAKLENVNNLSDVSNAATSRANLDIETSPTGSTIVATGTEAQRDGTPSAGYFRFNTDSDKFEGYNGTAWGSVGGGATGGGGDEVFFENGQTVTANYTITSGKNAISAGPITVNSGVTVTVPSGSNWVIV